MRLFIVRHGKAHRESHSGHDEDRELMPRGLRQAQFLGQVIAARDDVPDMMLASPVRRAIETARVIQESLGAPLNIEPDLVTGHSARRAINLIQEHHDINRLMLVGHNPQLEEVIEWLTRGRCSGCDALRTGEAVILDVPGGEIVGRCTILDRLRDESD